MEDKDFFDVSCEVGLATDALKHLVAVGTLTEIDIQKMKELRNSCIDYISAFDYYVEETCELEQPFAVSGLVFSFLTA